MPNKAFPESFADPLYASLDARYQQQYDLPVGLNAAVREHGERTNASQVSSAGARTPYQFTPATRRALLDKKGIDVYLNPENAAEGAAILLRESLDRNGGDEERAVREYHGGTNPKQWGPVNNAYWGRVSAGRQSAKVAELGRQFGEWLKANPATQTINAPATPSATSAPALDSRQSELMKEYGAFLQSQRPASELIDQIPDVQPEQPRAPAPGVGDQFARQAGLGVRALVNGVTGLPVLAADALNEVANLGIDGVNAVAGTSIPKFANANATVQGMLDGTGLPQPANSAERLTQALISGGAGGGASVALGKALSSGGGLVRQIIGNSLQEAPMAQVAAGAAGNAGSQVAADAGAGAVGQTAAALAGGVAGVASLPAAQAIASSAANTANRAAQAAGKTVKSAAQAVRERIPGISQEAAAARTRGGSAGAAATPAEMQRIATAEGLPVPVKLTKGAASRDAQQLAFEKEQLKGPLGQPLRDRVEENNLQILQNLESLGDSFDPATFDAASTGNAVTGALSRGYQAAKNKTNAAYRKARMSEEANAPVDLSMPVAIGEGDNAVQGSLISYLNGKVQGVPSAAVTDTARKLAVKLGIAAEDAEGSLIARPATVGKLEDFRRELAGTAKWDDRVGLREETILKKLTDAHTEPVAGPLFRDARATRQAQALKYENRGVVARLVNTVRGSDDPKVAADQVFRKSILNSSPEEITFLKRVLNTSGEDGQQAWKELQAATIRHIQEDSTKGVATDSAGRSIVSTAQLNRNIRTLDANGRLDTILGKQNAQVMRDLNDVLQYVNTVPPGTLVNPSGTAGTLLAALSEAGATGAMTGLPVPVISVLKHIRQQIQNKQLRQKISRALDYQTDKPAKSTGKF